MKCKSCNEEMFGRADKKFCSIKCKNDYHRMMKQQLQTAVKEIDSILHRNYAICLELMEQKRNKKTKIARLSLEKMGFNFNYYTGSYKNSQKKIYHYIYDFAWMEFSSQEIMVVKAKR